MTLRSVIRGTGHYLPDNVIENSWFEVAAVLAMTSLKRLQKRIDPRRVNGGIFLGLNGTVIKSLGSADATGVSAAIKLAFQLAQSGFQDRLAARVAQGAAASVTTGPQNEAAS